MTHTEECNLGNSILQQHERWLSLDKHIRGKGYYMSSWGRLRRTNANGDIVPHSSHCWERSICIKYSIDGRRKTTSLNRYYKELFGYPVTLPVYDKSKYSNSVEVIQAISDKYDRMYYRELMR